MATETSATAAILEKVLRSCIEHLQQWRERWGAQQHAPSGGTCQCPRSRAPCGGRIVAHGKQLRIALVSILAMVCVFGSEGSPAQDDCNVECVGGKEGGREGCSIGGTAR